MFTAGHPKLTGTSAAKCCCFVLQMDHNDKKVARCVWVFGFQFRVQNDLVQKPPVLTELLCFLQGISSNRRGAARNSDERLMAFSRSGSLCLVMPSVQPSGFSAGTFKAANVLAIKLSLINAFKQRRRLVLRHFVLRTHVEISAFKTNKQTKTRM